MFLPTPYEIKRLLRICDSRWTRKTQRLRYGDETFEFYDTYWWSDASQSLFDKEIAPYFAALESDFEPTVILDVGAATGQFSIVAASLFPSASLYAFEPAKRQRILLLRNARLNKVDKLEVDARGLWNVSAQLPFRTNGAESSVTPVSRLAELLPFREAVPVISLDAWVQEKQLTRVDLIKMDAEGAELEILQGARTTLATCRPCLLIQAYHLRYKVRTFEPCAEMLRSVGYDVEECPGGAGLLYAR